MCRMFLFVMFVFGIQQYRIPVPNTLPWLTLHCCIGCTRRFWQQRQENANAATEVAQLQAMHKETTRLAGEHKGGRVTSDFYIQGPVRFPVFVRLQVYLKRCVVLSLANAVSFYTISTASCTVRTFRSR